MGIYLYSPFENSLDNYKLFSSDTILLPGYDRYDLIEITKNENS